MFTQVIPRELYLLSQLSHCLAVVSHVPEVRMWWEQASLGPCLLPTKKAASLLLHSRCSRPHTSLPHFSRF